MGIFNFFLNTLGDLVMAPFQVETAWPGLVVFSVLVAVLAMLTYKYFSNQVALRDRRNRLLARVLEIRLYQDDIAGIFGMSLRIMMAAFSYIKESLRPLLIMLVPISLILIQMETWFEYRPLKSGDLTILSVAFDDTIDSLGSNISVTTSEGLALETEGLRSPNGSMVSWRLRSKISEKAWIDITVGDSVFRKKVNVAHGMQKISPKSVRAQLWNSIRYPAEPLMDKNSPIQSISLSYPKREFYVGRFSVNWIVAFFILTLTCGLIIKPVLKVEL